MNQTVLVALIFVLVLASVGTLVLAFAGSSANRESKKRLEKVRERFSDSAAVRAERTRKLRLNDNGSSLDQAMKGFIPKPAELRKRLAGTGKQISIGKYALLNLILVVVFTAGMMVAGGFPFPLSIIAGFVGGVGLPHIFVGSMIKKRLATFTKQFPDAIDLMVRGLRSGLPVSQSINAVAEEFAEPVGGEFHSIADKVRFGKTLENALWETAERVPTADFKFFVITLAIQRETGGNLAETLSNLSDILRKRQQLKLKIKAMSSEGKASAYIVGALPFLMFGILLFINYDYVSLLFTDPRGIMASVGALIWMGVGVFIMSRMINFEI